MTKTKAGQEIWRITATPMTEMALPKGAQFLSVRLAHSNPQLKTYWLVDPTAPMETRHLTVVQTGEPLPDGIYLGTEPMTSAHVIEIEAAFANA